MARILIIGCQHSINLTPWLWQNSPDIWSALTIPDNTAIPAKLNDNWLTAQLPEPMRQSCAIELADGSLKKGFRGNGFYLNPNCHLDYVKQRAQDIMRFGNFNSLFLDVDATAMAREDYSGSIDSHSKSHS